jgi:hypothetical protein
MAVHLNTSAQAQSSPRNGCHQPEIEGSIRADAAAPERQLLAIATLPQEFMSAMPDTRKRTNPNRRE